MKEAFTGTEPASDLVEKDTFAMSEAGSIERDEVMVTKRELTLYILK